MALRSIIVGVTMVKGFEAEQDVRMNVGETAKYWRLYVPIRWGTTGEWPELCRRRVGTFHVSQDGRETTVMYPEKRRYFVQNQTMTEAAIASGVVARSVRVIGRAARRRSLECAALSQALHRLDLGWLFDHGVGRRPGHQ